MCVLTHQLWSLWSKPQHHVLRFFFWGEYVPAVQEPLETSEQDLHTGTHTQTLGIYKHTHRRKLQNGGQNNWLKQIKWNNSGCLFDVLWTLSVSLAYIPAAFSSDVWKLFIVNFTLLRGLKNTCIKYDSVGFKRLKKKAAGLLFIMYTIISGEVLKKAWFITITGG